MFIWADEACWDKHNFLQFVRYIVLGLLLWSGTCRFWLQSLNSNQDWTTYFKTWFIQSQHSHNFPVIACSLPWWVLKTGNVTYWLIEMLHLHHEAVYCGSSEIWTNSLSTTLPVYARSPATWPRSEHSNNALWPKRLFCDRMLVHAWKMTESYQAGYLDFLKTQYRHNRRIRSASLFWSVDSHNLRHICTLHQVVLPEGFGILETLLSDPSKQCACFTPELCMDKDMATHWPLCMACKSNMCSKKSTDNLYGGCTCTLLDIRQCSWSTHRESICTGPFCMRQRDKGKCFELLFWMAIWCGTTTYTVDLQQCRGPHSFAVGEYLMYHL